MNEIDQNAMNSSGLEKSENISKWSRLRGAAWAAAIILFAMTWGLAALFSFNEEGHRFIAILSGGIICGTGTFPIIMLIFFMGIPIILLFVASGKATQALLICVILDLTAFLGYLRGNYVGPEVVWLCFLIVFLTPVVVFKYREKDGREFLKNKRVLLIYVVATLAIGAAGNAGWSFDRDEYFHEFASKRVNDLNECIHYAAIPKPNGQGILYQPEPLVNPPQSPKLSDLSPKIASCFYESGPSMWEEKYTWELRESDTKLSGVLIFVYKSKTYSHPFEIEKAD